MAILAQGREAGGLACSGGVIVALGCDSRTDVLSLHPRAQVDARNHLDLTTLKSYDQLDTKTESSTVRAEIQVRMCVWCRGRRVWGGAENAQNANLDVARVTRTLTLIGIGRPNGLVELGREELEYR